MLNNVYAFDGERNGDALWMQPLEKPVALDGSDPFCQNVHNVVQKEIGIVGTPVISAARQALYVVAFTKKQNGDYSYYLHALDLKNGKDKVIPPREIKAPGFTSTLQMQRASLLLSNDTVY